MKRIRNPDRLALTGVVSLIEPAMSWRQKMRLAKRMAVITVLVLIGGLYGFAALGAFLRGLQ